jgi:hypothetical protein
MDIILPRTTDRQDDDEQFCPDCFAGTESSERHEKCVAPLDQLADMHQRELHHFETEQKFAELCDAIEQALRVGAGSYVGHPNHWSLQERRDAVWRGRLRAVLSDFDERPGSDS